MSDKCLVIPREINQSYFMLWKQDEIIFLLLPWIFSLTLSFFLGVTLSLIGTIIAARVLKKLSIDKPNGYMLHWIRYNMPKQFVTASFKKNHDFEEKQSLFFKDATFPPSHLRHIAG